MPGQAAALHAAIPKDSIETAYCFLHQKRNVYIHSSLDWQKDDIATLSMPSHHTLRA